MPAPILHFGATVLCSHAGQATAASPFPRVLLTGQPVVTLTTQYVIAGCALSSVPSPPCVSGQFIVGAVRVMAGGQPVATMLGQSICTPTGTPMMPLVAQTRVLAT
ncbi:MAG TPA: hypothetical protein VGM82_09255 [Gemmatimonadaceae bacterium]|jgi:hypothetical protein